MFFYLENVYFDIIMIHSIEIDEIIITNNKIKISDFNVEFDKNEVLEFIHNCIGKQHIYYLPEIDGYKKSFYINVEYNSRKEYIILSLDNVLKYKIIFLDLINKFNNVGVQYR